jgi:hypothetical protein
LQVSGVLGMTPFGLLLLRRLPLTKLRLEQWTNTASDVSSFSCSGFVCLIVAAACIFWIA